MPSHLVHRPANTLPTHHTHSTMARKDTGVVNIHGKEYKTVALRVAEFRNEYTIKDGWGIVTSLVHHDEDTVIMRAEVVNPSGMVVGTGYAEEKRSASQINRTSAMEVSETSSIGRALAAVGLAGTEYASADEVANAIHQQSSSPKQSGGGYVPRASALTSTSGASEKQVGFAKSLLKNPKLSAEQRRDGMAYLDGDRTGKEVSAFIDRLKALIGDE